MTCPAGYEGFTWGTLQPLKRWQLQSRNRGTICVHFWRNRGTGLSAFTAEGLRRACLMGGLRQCKLWFPRNSHCSSAHDAGTSSQLAHPTPDIVTQTVLDKVQHFPDSRTAEGPLLIPGPPLLSSSPVDMWVQGASWGKAWALAGMQGHRRCTQWADTSPLTCLSEISST